MLLSRPSCPSTPLEEPPVSSSTLVMVLLTLSKSTKDTQSHTPSTELILLEELSPSTSRSSSSSTVERIWLPHPSLTALERSRRSSASLLHPPPSTTRWRPPPPPPTSTTRPTPCQIFPPLTSRVPLDSWVQSSSSSQPSTVSTTSPSTSSPSTPSRLLMLIPERLSSR